MAVNIFRYRFCFRAGWRDRAMVRVCGDDGRVGLNIWQDFQHRCFSKYYDTLDQLLFLLFIVTLWI
jgi:hypothetical protein